MKKLIDAVMTVLGIISAIGSVIIMYVLAAVSEAFTALAGVDTSGFGFDSMQMMATFQMFLNAGWIFSVAMLITSIYAVYCGINGIRSAK